MEAKESKILDILTEDKKYIIPSYQRPYSWNHEQAEQLIRDIHESFSEKVEEYFIGSLICIDKGGDEYEIVDGQQRLTTLSLIFAKIRDLIANDKVKSNIQKRILPIDDFSDKPQEARLKIRKKEESLYNNYILQGNKNFLPKEEDRTYTQNLFINNFQSIETYLTNEVGDEEQLKYLVEYILKNVFVVLVKTDSFASSYRLFNVLNTRGLSLKQSDLLKNRLFEISESDKFSSKIEEIWDQIEESIGVDKIDDFLILHEISNKKNRNKAVPVSKIAEHFSEKALSEYNGNVVEFALSLKKSADNFIKIRDIEFSSPAVCRILQCLSELSPEWIPPILAFLNKVEKTDSVISDNDFKDFVITFEKSYVNRWFAKYNKSQREVVCYDTVANLNNNLDYKTIKTKLLSHASNDVLKNYLNGNIYEPGSNRLKLVKYLLLRIDQEMQDVSVLKTYGDRITVEHILPQVISHEYWTNRFSKYEHTMWVHKLGNLTLISGHKNSKAQNDSFDKKLDIYQAKGNRVSFDIAKMVLDYEDWNLDNLKKRQKDLIDISLRIWSI